jgi:polyhydroxyalkanoate synthesis regulator phasin
MKPFKALVDIETLRQQVTELEEKLEENQDAKRIAELEAKLAIAIEAIEDVVYNRGELDYLREALNKLRSE